MIDGHSGSIHRRTPSMPWAALTAAAGTLFLPGAALAQACLGSPNVPGQTALQATASVYEEETGWGGDLRTNLPGRVAIGLGGEIIDVDELERDVRTARTDLAVDLAHREASVCPVVGVSYSTWRDDFFETTLDLSELRVPFGIALGSRLELDRALAFVPFALVGGYYYRMEDGVEVDGLTVTDEETGTELFAEAGAALAIAQLYLRGSVVADARDDVERYFRIGLGFVF